MLLFCKYTKQYDEPDYSQNTESTPDRLPPSTPLAYLHKALRGCRGWFVGLLLGHPNGFHYFFCGMVKYPKNRGCGVHVEYSADSVMITLLFSTTEGSPMRGQAGCFAGVRSVASGYFPCCVYHPPYLNFKTKVIIIEEPDPEYEPPDGIPPVGPWLDPRRGSYRTRGQFRWIGKVHMLPFQYFFEKTEKTPKFRRDIFRSFLRKADIPGTQFPLLPQGHQSSTHGRTCSQVQGEGAVCPSILPVHTLTS